MRKNTIHYSLLTCLGFLLLSAGVTAQNTLRQQQIDSLRSVIPHTEGEAKLNTYLQLSSHYYPLVADDSMMSEFLALSAEIDAEAARQKRYDCQGLLQLNILMAYLNRGENQEVIRLAPGYLDFLASHEVWGYYYQVRMKLCRAYLRAGDVKMALWEAQKMVEHARNRQNNKGMALALTAMSEVYYTQYRFDRQIECLQQSIELLRDNSAFYHVSINAYGDLCRSLVNLNRNEEALRNADRLENLINEYETIAKTPVLNARWLLWSIRISAYTATGRYDEAEALCRKFDNIQVDLPNKANVCLARAQILLSRKQYRDALEQANRAMELDRPYLMEGYRTQKIRNIQIESLIKLGQAEKAYALFKENIAARDSIQNLAVSAQLDEIRTQYEVDKITAEKERISIEKQLNHNYFLFALGGTALLTITVVIIFINRQKIRRKNKTLVSQISGLLELQQFKKNELLAKTTFETPLQDNAGVSGLYRESRRDKICLALRDLLLKEKIYRNDQLTRDNLVEQLGTTRYVLEEAFLFCFGKHYSEYIGELRLNDAVALLRQSNLSIVEISEKVGFGTVRTFHRQFTAHYNVSPKDYRQAVQENPTP